MKKLLFFAAFLLVAGISVNAQSETKKSCNKPCSHSEKATTSEASNTSKALMAANSDENIEVKTCEESGNVSYYRKDVCEQSGKVSYTQVEYQESTGSFAVKASNDEKVNAAPAKADEKKSCSSKASKADCSSKASKAGCSSKAKADGKECCSSKASTASMSPAKKGCCSSSAKKSCSSKS